MPPFVKNVKHLEDHASLLARQLEARKIGLDRPMETLDRKYLTLAEVQKLVHGARLMRNGDRNAFMLLFMFRHALRASEVCNLRWSHIDPYTRTVWIQRAKGGKSVAHTLELDEIYEFTQLPQFNEYVFNCERKKPFSTRGLYKLVETAGKKAKLNFKVHPHMLRHAKGYHLANNNVPLLTIKEYMGHKSVKSTTIYTEIAASQYAGLGKDNLEVTTGGLD